MKTYTDLNFRMMTYSDLAEAGTNDYSCVYRLWKSGWQETFCSLGLDTEALSSDDFINRKSYVLFNYNAPVALILGSKIAINEISLDLKYFKMYDRESLAYINKYFQSVYTISYLYISKDWRKHNMDVPLGDVLFGLITRDFSQNDIDAMISCVRDNRKINDVFSRFGAQTLGCGHEYNVNVSYMYLTKKLMSKHPNIQIRKAIDFLWDEYLLFKEKRNESRNIKDTPAAAS